MILTIDTTKDSPTEIQKAILFLQQFVGQSSPQIPPNTSSPQQTFTPLMTQPHQQNQTAYGSQPYQQQPSSFTPPSNTYGYASQLQQQTSPPSTTQMQPQTMAAVFDDMPLMGNAMQMNSQVTPAQPNQTQYGQPTTQTAAPQKKFFFETY